MSIEDFLTNFQKLNKTQQNGLINLNQFQVWKHLLKSISSVEKYTSSVKNGTKRGKSFYSKPQECSERYSQLAF